MGTNPEVERWLKARDDPPEATMRRVREIILGADRRMTEQVKYGTVMFGFEGDMATFVQATRKDVNLMFNRGARIQGAFPHLEGSGPTARFMHFADVAEANARATELNRIVAAWCTMMAAGGPKPKPISATKTVKKAAATRRIARKA